MHTRHARRTAVIASVAGILAMAGCGAAPEQTAASGAADPDFLACAVSGSGGWNDKSFNEQVREGLTKAEDELGVKTLAFESQTSDDFVPGIDSMIAQNCTLIFSVGFDANEAVNAAAKANPETDFVTIDGFSEDESTTNLKPVSYDMTQSAYLGGYLAASQSATHTIATFGAIQNAAITDFMTGYAHGAQRWAEDEGVPTSVIGWDPSTEEGLFVGGFDDQVAAKNIAAAQLDQGADVLFPVAGPLFAAAAAAIEESGSKAVFLGVDSDVAVTSPDLADLVLVSVEKRMTDAVVSIIQDAAGGDFDSTPYIGTLDNGGTGLSDLHDFSDVVPADMQKRLEQLSADIVEGTIDPTE